MTRVQPGTARWAELIREAIRLDGQRNWFLGDAALEIAPMGDGPGPNGGANADLEQFAGEIGVEYHSLLAYRQVAARWEFNTRVSNTGWTVHRMLVTHPELIRPGMTMPEAREALSQQRDEQQPPEPPPPPPLPPGLSLPSPEAMQQRREAERAARTDEERILAADGIMADARLLVVKAIRELEGATSLAADEDARIILADRADRLKAAVALFELRLTGTSGTDWDTELARLL
jgi:hypothetical protein